jgi:plasmid maintenance system antidote protein VapI
MRSALLSPEHSAYRLVVQAAYPARMAYDSPRQLRRRENLRKLLQEAGGQAQAALELGTPKSHLSAILAGRRGVGDELADKIERHFGKPVGWMDMDHETESRPMYSPDVEAFAAEADQLPAHLKRRVLILWKEALGFAREALNPQEVPDENQDGAGSEIPHRKRKSM